MKIIAFLERHQTEVIEKILRHCGLWEEGPARGPPGAEGEDGRLKEQPGRPSGAPRAKRDGRLESRLSFPKGKNSARAAAFGEPLVQQLLPLPVI
jgi:hypothetical protein